MKKKQLRHYIERANEKGLFRWIPDKYCLYILYWARLGKWLNLKNPKTFNEKLQWLKLHNRKPEFNLMVDKYEVKKYIADKIGEEYIIPTIGIWNQFNEIDFNALPNQFVLKCTHDSGGLIIVRNKMELDWAEAMQKINRSLKKNYYWHGREWPYKNVEPRIMAEQYMTDAGNQMDTGELTDYKFMCFHGKVENIFTMSERYSKEGLKITVFDKEWNRLSLGRQNSTSSVDIAKPQNFEKMIHIAEVLSKDIPFLRVDFYEVAGRVYFGEFTFFPASGMKKFYPESWDLKLGELIDLQRVNL